MRSRHRRLRYELLETRDLLTTVQIADEFVGHPAGRVTVPVDIDEGAGVRAAEIRIAYDAAQLDVQPKDIAAGTAWAGKAIAISKVDQQAGVIVVFAFSAESLSDGAGSLIEVSFTVRGDAPSNITAIDLAEVRLNEGQIELSAVPVLGADATDGSIAVKSDPISQFENTAVQTERRACVVERRAESQVSFVQPSLPIAPAHSLHSTLVDKPAWLSRDRRFIGPSLDPLFATTQRWLLDS